MTPPRGGLVVISGGLVTFSPEPDVLVVVTSLEADVSVDADSSAKANVPMKRASAIERARIG
jgi:hypothetical protein